MKSIGVGCFHFGIAYEKEFIFSTKRYVEDVRAALGKISSVGDISIDYDATFEEEFVVTKKPLELRYGEVFPRVEFLRVYFTVYIPARMQVSVLGEDWAPKRTGTENFKVYVISTYYGPISFVESIDAAKGSDPAYSVRVVRTFLANEFERIKASITFEFMGPSPFHANFYLKSDADEKIAGDLVWAELSKRGYNEIRLTYNLSKFASGDEALGYFISEIDDEIGLFYRIIIEKNKSMFAWDGIEAKIDKLNRDSEPGVSLLNFKRQINLHKLRRGLIDRLYQFKAEGEMSRSRVKDLVESAYGKQLNEYLRKYVEKSVSRFPEYPVSALIEWLTHGESRMLKQLEIGVVLASAVLGGLIGSLITAIAGG